MQARAYQERLEAAAEIAKEAVNGAGSNGASANGAGEESAATAAA